MNTKYQGLQRARAYGMPRTFARISETITHTFFHLSVVLRQLFDTVNGK